MSTSDTYTFLSPQSRILIDEAYERIGIPASQVGTVLIEAAQRSLNFILQDWANKGNNLWTIRHGLLGLNAGQNAYYLPSNLSDILTATIRTSNRNLGGTPGSSSGVAAYAFDNNTATACTQTGPDGNISYNWNLSTYATAMVGIQSNATLDYTISCEYSNDDAVWTSVLDIPTQSYPVGQIQWFVVPVPVTSSRFRILETGGATLNVQEVYFNTALVDSVMTRISEQDYTSYSNKNSPGKPSVYWVDRQISPVVYLYETPSSLYKTMYYTYQIMMQDIGSMVNSAEVPARFVEPLCAALTCILALKNGNDLNLINYMNSMAEAKYIQAGREDAPKVPLTVSIAGRGISR